MFEPPWHVARRVAAWLPLGSAWQNALSLWKPLYCVCVHKKKADNRHSEWGGEGTHCIEKSSCPWSWDSAAWMGPHSGHMICARGRAL